MPHNASVSLTASEKSIIKALLNGGWRNQDVLTLINTGRLAPINSGRISGVKSNASIQAATKEQVAAYKLKKLSFDHVTGLCPFEDERLVRSREAMILAVQLFNTPRLYFKAGVFAMLANVAWTYLFHEYYDRKNVKIVKDNGFSLALSEMTARADSPITPAIKKNLDALKKIRDVVEHQTIGLFDRKWLPIFQSTCLNFENTIKSLFGERLSLGTDLGFVLQFAKLGSDDIALLQNFDIPEHIASLDAGLAEIAGDESDNLEYQFKVVYTLASATKSKANFQFVLPDSAEGKEIQNVLIKYKMAEDLYPFKPYDAVKAIKAGSGRAFTSDKHQRAWKLYKARPAGNAKNPAATDEKYCVYHPAFKAYTYSQAWIDFVVAKVTDDAGWLELCTYKNA